VPLLPQLRSRSCSDSPRPIVDRADVALEKQGGSYVPPSSVPRPQLSTLKISLIPAMTNPPTPSSRQANAIQCLSPHSERIAFPTSQGSTPKNVPTIAPARTKALPRFPPPFGFYISTFMILLSGAHLHKE